MPLPSVYVFGEKVKKKGGKKKKEKRGRQTGKKMLQHLAPEGVWPEANAHRDGYEEKGMLRGAMRSVGLDGWVALRCVIGSTRLLWADGFRMYDMDRCLDVCTCACPFFSLWYFIDRGVVMVVVCFRGFELHSSELLPLVEFAQRPVERVVDRAVGFGKRFRERKGGEARASTTNALCRQSVCLDVCRCEQDLTYIT